MPAIQACYWMLTIPFELFVPYLPPGYCYVRGQLEIAASGFQHWQLIAYAKTKVSLASVRATFGPVHAEPTRSGACREYVWKEETRVAGTQFELGELPFRRNSKPDWDAVLLAARAGLIDSIPPDIQVRCYHQLRRIGSDYVQPVSMERSAKVFWGRTGTGKSRLAWEEAGLEAYSKDPRTKWWDGYLGQANVVIDEFRGTIDIAHLLRWLDRYPVRVENKGGSVSLSATRFWFTSNLDPRLWYPDVDSETVDALVRRIEIHHFN
jgi:hypothetical protein